MPTTLPNGPYSTSPSLSIVDRRRFLTLAGAGAVGGLAATASMGVNTRPAEASAQASTADDDAAPGGETGRAPALTFAVITDTHANSEQPARLELLPRIFGSILRANPDFVMNCGDIVDHSAQSEYDTYLSTIPDGLRSRVRHVPGNHDVRWDMHGGQLYRELFGPAPYTFETAGLHVVGLDPTTVLQEPGNFGPWHLRWLIDNLPAKAPSVLFLHFPFGDENYYLNDQDAFFEAVAHLPVRAVFAGHVHREGVSRFNGFTQVTALAARNVALYYWVEQHMDDGHPVLQVTTVGVAADGSESRAELTTIPLSGYGEGRLLRPRKVVLDLSDGASATVRVDAGRDATPAVVRAQVYPQHVYGRTDAGSWADLATTGRGRWWSGSVDISGLPPGRHRMQLRVVGDDGATYEATEGFELAAGGGTPRERWSMELGGAVQGALAERDGVVVAGSTAGDVVAMDGARGRERWRREFGPVYRGAEFSADGSIVYVPSADHRLYALDAATGADLWNVATSHPVLSTPLVTTIGDAEAVVFSAGPTMHARRADGEQLWSTDLGSFFAGRAACDGERVYTGGGEGYAYAFDAATGERLWSFDATDRTDTYGRLLYGPWDDTVELLPDGLVMFATVTTTYAVDGGSGEVQWQLASGAMYPPSRLTDDGLFLVDEWGRYQFLDPATGTSSWSGDLGVRVLNAGPVMADGTVWIVATTGLLVGIDLLAGDAGHYLQVGPANTYSTPVVVNGVLVVGDQDGGLRGIALPG